jgi:hypothetical protein
MIGINDIELMDDAIPEIDWEKDADERRPPPPDGIYLAQADFQENDADKRFAVKFARKEGDDVTTYPVVKINGGKSGTVTVKVGRGEEEQEVDLPQSEGVLYLSCGLILTLVNARPDEKTGEEIPGELYETSRVYTTITSKLKENKTSTMTDFLKAYLSLDEARQCGSSNKMASAITQIVAGRLSGWVNLVWEGQTESYNRDSDGKYLKSSQVPKGMKNFTPKYDEKGNVAKYLPVVEKLINGTNYEFVARAAVRHWIPLRDGTGVA